jgi:stage II sporulation protein D
MKFKKMVPEIQIGIFSGIEITLTFNSVFRNSIDNSQLSGTYKASCLLGRIILKNSDSLVESENEILLSGESEEFSSFILHGVTIGVNFHWQRKEDQVFKGKLRLLIEEDKIVAVNIITIEDYLLSVISSEMSATSSLELLKAHAVVSRSWLLAQMEKSKVIGKNRNKYETSFISDSEVVRWYDREDHKLFDVCADDHCQRYQGISRASTPIVNQVIRETFGEVLTYGNTICDSRYYKCCGGITELFENVWEPINHPYIQKVIDNAIHPEGYNLNLENEENAVKWISGSPESFCNTSDKKVLKEILNDYDQETNDFYRWKVTYTQQELSELVKNRTGIDFGKITDLIPLERGVSGRITRLKIVGKKKTMIIGKELEIRKALSKTHLYSSCFFAEKKGNENDLSFILHGAGWGHGVGLCQIAAAVMGSMGYSYREILDHYFKNAILEKRY